VPRAVKRVAQGAGAPAAIDTLILTSSERRAQRATLRGSKGTEVIFDFSEPIALRTDDIVMLETGETVEIVAAAEPLLEVRADLSTLARLAWALGDRHLPVQIFANRIRLHRGAAAEGLIAAVGARATPIEAPFEPEGGAYADHGIDAHAHDRHHHGHDHGDGHGHHHHDHSHHAHHHGDQKSR
jgi:urease accessory protein